MEDNSYSIFLEDNIKVCSRCTSNKSKKLIGLFMHYDDGDIINIQDLPKDEYEKFLEQMNALRLAYISLTNRFWFVISAMMI